MQRKYPKDTARFEEWLKKEFAYWRRKEREEERKKEKEEKEGDKNSGGQDTEG